MNAMITVVLEPSSRTFGSETWEVKRERLDAAWKPLVDEKGRKVHGWALIEETPPHVLGRVLVNEHGSYPTAMVININANKPFSVQLIATRDGKNFGRVYSTAWCATREEALAYAKKALIQQGKLYKKKYGGAP